MRAEIVRLLLVSLVAVLPIGGCTGTTAPQKWLPTAETAPTDAYGAWAHLSLISSQRTIDGELIAVANETVCVMIDTLVAIPRTDIWDIKLTRFEQEHGGLAMWTVTGTLGTLSHGFFLLGTLPAWAISGSITTGNASREPIVHPRSEHGVPISVYQLRPLAMYARFPQGLPRTMDRSKLRPRLR